MPPTPRLHAVDLAKLEQAMKSWPEPEVCEDCNEVVRYWNPEGGGDGLTSCACCTEGAESCAPIKMPPGITVEDIRTLITLAVFTRDGAPTLKVKAS